MVHSPIHLLVIISSRGSLLLSDIILLVITWKQLYHPSMFKNILYSPMTLSKLLLWDGEHATIFQ